MEHRRAAAGATRGGVVISTLRTRVVTAIASLAALAGANLFGLVAHGKYASLEPAFAALSLALLLLGLGLRRIWPTLWAVALAGASYAIGRAGHPTIDTRAAIVGVLLLVTTELASWSIDAQPRFTIEWRVHARRGTIVATVVACAAGVDAFVLAAAGVEVTPSVALAAVGSAAAAGAIALVVLAKSS
ncbi:MAG TPA: hypothetical protein VGH52_10010 [Gaiellaceae bacterium]|jgi:hypothetical protein